MASGNDKSQKEKADPQEIARKIWLAGLGAYGQTLENLHRGYDKMSAEARERFEALVARGQELERASRERLETAGETAVKRLKDNLDAVSAGLGRWRAELGALASKAGHGVEEVVAEVQSQAGKLLESVQKLLFARPAEPAARKRAGAKSSTGEESAKGSKKAPAKGAAPTRKSSARAAASTSPQKAATRKTTTRKTAAKRSAPAAPPPEATSPAGEPPAPAQGGETS